MAAYLATSILLCRAQQAPVEVTTLLLPPYSLRLSDYAMAGLSNFQVQLLLKDMTKPEHQVKLRLEIEGPNLYLRSREEISAAPITLQGGLLEILTGDQLWPYFRLENLDFQGYSKSKYRQAGQLPEGFYRFSVEVLDYHRGTVLSNRGQASGWLVLNEPPWLDFPEKEARPRATDPQQLSFSWTPRHLNNPNSAYSTEYVFEIYEVRPRGSNIDHIVESTQPLYQEVVPAPSLGYGPSQPLLEPGGEYAWRVQARDTEGRSLYRNQGWSEVRKFSWGEACKVPQEIEARAISPGAIGITWEGAWNHSEYRLEYGVKGGNWYPVGGAIVLDQYLLENLQPSTTYQFRLSGMCGSVQGPWSEAYLVKTHRLDEDRKCCSDRPIGEPSPVMLEAELYPGDTMIIGNQDMILLEVEGRGLYSGYAAIDWKFTPGLLKVKFTEVQFDSKRQYRSGEVVSTYNSTGKRYMDLDQVLEGIKKREQEAREQGLEPEEEEEEEDQTVRHEFNGEVDTVFISGDHIIVRDTLADTYYYYPEDAATGKKKEVQITDSQGHTWVVDSEGRVSKGGSGSSSGTTSNPDIPTDSVAVDSVMIEGLSRNADLVTINEITSSFKPDSGRLELTYTVIDTLNLTHTKLEIYKLGEEDTTMVTFYSGLEKGEDIEFIDSQDDNNKGWSGKGSDGEFVEAGEYRAVLTAAVDESFSNGYEDYEQFEVLAEDQNDEIYDYFVTEDDAWYRQKEAPYETITPEPRTNILGKSLQVAVLEIVQDDNGKDVAKIKLKDTGGIEYTTFSNLTQVKEFSKERKYKFLKGYTALKIPFSGNTTDKTYKKDAEITVHKHFGNYLKVTGYDHWIEKTAVIWIDKISTEKIISETQNATKVGTKYTGNETSVACNICVRSALLLLKEDQVLFPLEGSAYYDPADAFKVSYIKGSITNPGRAKNIKEDFDVITSKFDLNARFTEIEKNTSEDWEVYFKRLQDKADTGGIVVGVMLNSSGTSGHIMMITPGGLVDIDETTSKWGFSYLSYNRNVKKVPKVLECGTGERENEAPLCRNVDYNGATKRLKWFVYKN